MSKGDLLKTEDEEVFEWIKFQEDTSHNDLITEPAKEKFLRKLKENPFVPFGVLLTTGCLGFGLYSFQQGRQRMSQMMMRARVIAQGFTVIAIAGGILMATRKELKK